MTPPRSVRATAFAAFGAILLTACSFLGVDGGRVGFELVNRTEVGLTVTFVTEDVSVMLIQDLPPGGSLNVDRFVTRDACVAASMVATAAVGEIVAAFPGPVCDGTVWEILPEPGLE